VKIRAIRLKEVGCFSAPTALEGLSGELDVLSGPNELGKSTILKAVKLALCEKHTSAKLTVDALRPYAGGAPLVEVDFEIGGSSWRIRKQFLASRSAELRNLRSGEIARGADAETALAKLLSGADGTDRFALLWVDQGAALARLNPAEKAGGALHAVVEGEVQNVADGGAARFVEAGLKAELAELETAHNPPRPTGRYKAALEEQRSLASRRDAAAQRLTSANARLNQLEVIRENVTRLALPATAAARAQAKAETAWVFEAARTAHERLRLAHEALARYDEKVFACETALETMKAKIADLSKLEEAAVQDAPLLAELTKRLREDESRAEAARKKRDEIKESLVTAEREAKAHEHAAALRDLADRLKAAQSAENERKRLADALAANRAADGLLGAARRAATSIATLSARLEAAAPKVSIAYAAGGNGKIKIGGKPVGHGETLHPTRAIALEIEGVGVVTIAPGHSEGADDDAADIAALKAELTDVLGKIGATSLDDAERRAEERRALQTQLAEASAHLQAQAPDGIERLKTQHAERSKRAALLGPAPTRTLEELAILVPELSAARANAEEAFELAAAQRNDTQMRQGQSRVLADERAMRIKQLTVDLGDAAARKAKLDKLLATLSEATAAGNAATREAAAWREQAPDEAQYKALKQAADAAAGSVESAERELAELRRTEAGIEGELKSDRAEDVAASVAELDDACVVSAARLKTITEELAALRLLQGELNRAHAETRSRFAKPVLDRLMPYLHLVFPDAQPQLGDGFVLESLKRGETAETVTALSEGTREQLAVLVRLGFGRLLAEAGNSAPLILDDALVYSDDRRIERMFEALKLAAKSHQVVVLTCRERTFAGLGGNRVTLAPWRPN